MEFEKRRNVPVKYDRQLVQSTLVAMKRIQEIKSKRERVVFKKRLLHKSSVSSVKETTDKNVQIMSNMMDVDNIVINKKQPEVKDMELV